MKKKYLGIVYIVISAFCFALMNMFVRLSGELPFVQKSFFRNLVALVFALIILKKEGVWFSGKKGNIKYLVLRSIAGTLGIFCNYYAIDRLVLADASMLNKMSPFFAIVFSYFILKEKIKPAQAVIVVTAFLGSLLIIKPTTAIFQSPAALIGLLGGLGAGIAYTFVRVLGEKGERGPFVVFVFSSFSCLVSLGFMVFGYHPMSGMQLVYLLLAGLSAAGGQFSITAAYFHAPAREISVYDYSQIIFSALLGFMVFGQIPDVLSWAGYLVICSMAVLMFIYNHRVHGEKTANERIGDS
jgi:drug/metabolite transporter (DMT)-like permease